ASRVYNGSPGAPGRRWSVPWLGTRTTPSAAETTSPGAASVRAGAGCAAGSGSSAAAHNGSAGSTSRHTNALDSKNGDAGAEYPWTIGRYGPNQPRDGTPSGPIAPRSRKYRSIALARCRTWPGGQGEVPSSTAATGAAAAAQR